MITRNLVAIALGAGLGALSRYGVALLVTSVLKSDFPMATLVVNLTGCLLLGGVTAYFQQSLDSFRPEVRLLVTTGYLGSYTTFSTFELDTARLFASHRLLMDGIYWLSSDCLGLASLALGAGVVKRFYRHV